MKLIVLPKALSAFSPRPAGRAISPRRLLLPVLASLSLLLPRALAATAYPGIITQVQSDGSPIELRMEGDEYYAAATTADGYTVVEEGGVYYYAVREENGNLGSSGRRADSKDPPPGLLPKLHPTEAAYEKECAEQMLLCGRGKTAADPVPAETRSLERLPPLRGLQKGKNAPQQPLPPITSGILKNLVVLIKFNDHQSRNLPSREDIDTLLNHEGADALAPTGSVRDLFLQSLNGQLDIRSTVIDWIALPRNESYYADGKRGLGLTKVDLVKDALNSVSGVNFTEFDTDGDKFIDSLAFLHSGYAAEFGGTDEQGSEEKDRMWSHQGVLDGNEAWTSGEGGVRVNKYIIASTLWSTSGSEIARVGVIAHELGHVLGLPDLYDGDFSDGDYVSTGKNEPKKTTASGNGIGNWCLMANYWGFNVTDYDLQLHPPILSAWSRVKLGMNFTTITRDGYYTVGAAGSDDNVYPQIYRIEALPFKQCLTELTAEFFLIEYRSPSGFETTMPSSGLAIYHIDSQADFNTEGYPNMTDTRNSTQTKWPENGKHYQVALLQKDGNYDLERGINKGDGTDLFGVGDELMPSQGGGMGPYPNTDSYQSRKIVPTGIEIDEISVSGSTMTFRVTGVSSPAAPTPALTKKPNPGSPKPNPANHQRTPRPASASPTIGAAISCPPVTASPTTTKGKRPT